MKYLLVLALLFPLPAFAQAGAPPRSPTPFCFNIGHAAPSPTRFSQQLSLITSKCIRLAYQGQNSAETQTLAFIAKSQGFYVIIGNTFGVMQATDYPRYDAGVLAQARWAQSYQIDQLSLGNEQEYRLSDITQQEWADHLRTLATQVRAVYSGKISYETSGIFTYWNSQTLGDIDLIGLNLYCGFACNENFLRNAIKGLGVSHVYVSETNADMDTGLYENDGAHAEEVKQDALVLHRDFPSTPLYFFAFSANGDLGVPRHWGIYNGARLMQPLTASVLGLPLAHPVKAIGRDDAATAPD